MHTMTDDEPSHGITLLGAAAAAADIAQESLDAAFAMLPPSHMPADLRERSAAGHPDRWLVLAAALAVEDNGHDVAPSCWQLLADGAGALYEWRMAQYAAGRANGWPRRTLSDVLASLVLFERLIPADIFADVETTAEQVRGIIAAAQARVGLTDDAWANASFNDLTVAFAPCVSAGADWLDSEVLAGACYDLYDWLPTLDVGGEWAPMFTRCLWTLLEYQVRELQRTD